MILVDANLLLYAKLLELPQHPRALEWLDAQLNSPHRVGLPWPTTLAFLRIATNPRVFEKPMDTASAWRQVLSWLALPNVWIPQPTERHVEILGDLLVATSATSRLVPDAHLAALAIEHGVTLCSTDGDFARFPLLRWENPLS